MVDQPIALDEHRGLAEQRATDFLPTIWTRNSYSVAFRCCGGDGLRP